MHVGLVWCGMLNLTYKELNVDEGEHAMVFLTGSTIAYDPTKGGWCIILG